MAQTVTPAVIFPRFTAVVGQHPYASLPIDVTKFESVYMTFWRGPFVGTGTSLTFKFQASTDRYIWTDVGAQVSPGEDEEKVVSFGLDQQWLRAVANLSGSNPGATFWAQGYFVNREENDPS